MKLSPIVKKRLWIAGAVILLALLLFQLFIVIPIARRNRELLGYGSPEANYAAIRNNPDDIGAYRGLAEYYFLMRNDAEAIKALREVTRIDPNDDFYALRLARTLTKRGQKAEAIKVYRKLAQEHRPFKNTARRALRDLQGTS